MLKSKATKNYIWSRYHPLWTMINKNIYLSSVLQCYWLSLTQVNLNRFFYQFKLNHLFDFPAFVQPSIFLFMVMYLVMYQMLLKDLLLHFELCFSLRCLCLLLALRWVDLFSPLVFLICYFNALIRYFFYLNWLYFEPFVWVMRIACRVNAVDY